MGKYKEDEIRLQYNLSYNKYKFLILDKWYDYNKLILIGKNAPLKKNYKKIYVVANL